MTAPTDAERAREMRDVIGECICPEDFHDPDCVVCAVVAALAAVRTEERERAARIAEDREAPVISDAIRRRQEG